MENVDKDTIHGWYGIETTWETWRKINKKKVVSSWHELYPSNYAVLHGTFDAYMCSNYILNSNIKKPRVRPHIILHTHVLLLQWHENTRFIQKHRVKQPRGESIHSICFWIACPNTLIKETIHIDLLRLMAEILHHLGCMKPPFNNGIFMPIIYRVSYIPGGARCLPSTAWPPTTSLFFRKHSTGLC